LLKINIKDMKKIKLALTGIVCLFFGIAVYAQQENRNLHLPPEFDGAGQKVYESFDYVYSRTSEYVNANDVITKEGMDSVTRVAVLDFFAMFDSTTINPVVADMISGKKSVPNIPDDPQLKTMMNEMMNVVRNSSSDLDKMAKQFGAINQKAAANLPEKAVAVYATSCVTYYSAVYWKDNLKKWNKLRDKAKKKAKK
jgi:hypothetical protein